MKLSIKKSLILAFVAVLAMPVFAFTVTIDNIKYSINSEGATIIDGSACSGTVTIRDTVSYTYPGGKSRYKIIEIGDSAFMNNSKITRVNLYSKYLTRIGVSAFDSCTAITYVSSVTTNDSKIIDDHAFAYCSSLQSIFTGASKIGRYAFNNCTNLLLASISGTATSVGNGAFNNCKNLKVVSLPESVDTIGQYAFSSCDSLVYAPLDHIKVINHLAFSYCKSLTTICLPYCIEKIGYDAFFQCPQLMSVYNMSKKFVPLSNGQAFDSRYVGNMTLYVRNACLSDYTNGENWKDFGYIQSLDGVGVNYDINGDGNVNSTDIPELQKIILGN